MGQQYQVLQQFAASGGSFAVHAGDSVCGGGSFGQPAEEYERSLEAVAAVQRAVLGTWPVFYAPGNHDVDPTVGGLAKWQQLLGDSGMGEAASVHLCTSAPPNLGTSAPPHLQSLCAAASQCLCRAL